MTHHENLKIIAFVGLPGAGQSTAVKYFTEKGYPKVYFGGVLYQAMEEAGLERTASNEQKFREEIREQKGKDFLANKIVEQIENLANSGQHRIVIDGLYTWTEYQVLKKAFPGELEVVAIVAPRHLRYRRLAERAERPYTATEAHERDITEIEHLEKGGPIAIADHYVVNDESVDNLGERLGQLAESFQF